MTTELPTDRIHSNENLKLHPLEKSDVFGGESQFSDIALASAITSTRANFSKAAELLKVSRTAIQHRVNDNPELKQLVKDIREGGLDNAESNLDKAVDKEESWAIMFKLKTLGKSRGYTEQHDFNFIREQLNAIEDALKQRSGRTSSEDQSDQGEGGNRPTGAAEV